ncbi:hypothetical protein KFZ76_20575 [Methylovulum psychrotolerans]|uniref:dual OB domain-containing protein n=1 Tax=Methylovulum psychrotolerans TaxID=1704499 RepID=UPI001BFF1FE2|nr:hypothetical protein [Methylovulum psychrotolerans]MBT9100102.1 hypothetical protein [Methylovulum psychrotolerans]
MNVLIVSKTRMGDYYRCVGGIEIGTNKAVRLLQQDGNYQSADTTFQIGEVWDIQCTPQIPVIPPHIEGVCVYKQKLIGTRNVRNYILNSTINIWRGGIANLFDDLIDFTGNGSGYISHQNGVPRNSTGFWICNTDLDYDDKHYSDGMYRIKYAGLPKPLPRIPKGTLVRVSLPKWWKPDGVDMEERCYVQLSGWY